MLERVHVPHVCYRRMEKGSKSVEKGSKSVVNECRERV